MPMTSRLGVRIRYWVRLRSYSIGFSSSAEMLKSSLWQNMLAAIQASSIVSSLLIYKNSGKLLDKPSLIIGTKASSGANLSATIFDMIVKHLLRLSELCSHKGLKLGSTWFNITKIICAQSSCTDSTPFA